MNEQQLPAEILTIIQTRQAAIREEARAKAEKEQQDLAALQTVGKEKFDQWLAEQQIIPDYLRPYQVEHYSNDEMKNIYERIAKNWGWEYKFYFVIPGLTNIQYTDRQGWVEQILRTDDNGEPCVTYDGPGYKDPEKALISARINFVKYRKALEEWKQSQAERQANQKKREQEEIERETKAWNAASEARAREREEEQDLLNAIKDDPAAMNMLKAFILIQDERRNFQEQLNSAYESASYMEDRYSQRVAELRRQADDLERRAADEKALLQDELDEAEKKAKKAQRGW